MFVEWLYKFAINKLLIYSCYYITKNKDRMLYLRQCTKQLLISCKENWLKIIHNEFKEILNVFIMK